MDECTCAIRPGKISVRRRIFPNQKSSPNANRWTTAGREDAGLPIECEVERRGRMRERPDADPVDSRFSYRTDCLQSDAAGGF